jgi:hypothetical protein
MGDCYGKRAKRCYYLCGLLERLLVHGDEDDCVRTLSVFSRGLDILDDVLAGGEIDECCCTQLLHAHLLLLLTSIDGDHSQAHGFGVLLSKGSESATGTNDGNGLARASA